jgi:hypothetical protein
MLDEFGSERPDDYIAGFPPHPHRGFQTVTYMLEGHMLHEDHLGNRGHLQNGGVQWMNAGRGIIHSEMPQQDQGRMRGFQLWINSPAKEKMSDPFYLDLPAATIPVYDDAAGIQVKVIAGRLTRAHDIEGPVKGAPTEPVFWDVSLAPGVRFTEPLPVSHAVYLYVYEGAVELPSAPTTPAVRLESRHGAILSGGETLECAASEDGARFLVMAGRPIAEPIVQHGPFVMNTEDEIREAIRDYRAGRLALAAAEVRQSTV